MPLFSWKCDSCKHITEDIISVSAIPSNKIQCENCNKDAYLQFPRIARTAARWGSSCGYFDRGLGVYIENSQHRERIAKERGLVNMADFSNHYEEDTLEKEQQEFERGNKDTEKFVELVKKGRTKEQAANELFTEEYMIQNGTLKE